MVMVFLDGRGKYSRQGDADRIKKWLAENNSPLPTLTGSKIASGQS